MHPLVQKRHDHRGRRLDLGHPRSHLLKRQEFVDGLEYRRGRGGVVSAVGWRACANQLFIQARRRRTSMAVSDATWMPSTSSVITGGTLSPSAFSSCHATADKIWLCVRKIVYEHFQAGQHAPGRARRRRRRSHSTACGSRGRCGGPWTVSPRARAPFREPTRVIIQAMRGKTQAPTRTVPTHILYVRRRKQPTS